MASPKPDATEAYSMESKKAQGAMNDALSNALTTAEAAAVGSLVLVFGFKDALRKMGAPFEI